jgi:hypothetical protein
MAVKLRKPVEIPAPNGDTPSNPPTIPLVPLVVSGLIVSKESLIATLRGLVPGLVSIDVIDDGHGAERFLLSLAPAVEEGTGPGASRVGE